MLRKRNNKSQEQYLAELKNTFHHIKLTARDSDRLMYETLIREFPELKGSVLIYDVDGIGLGFSTSSSGGKFTSLKAVYENYLPEINRRAELRTYEQELTNYIDGKSDISNDSSTKPHDGA